MHSPVDSFFFYPHPKSELGHFFLWFFRKRVEEREEGERAREKHWCERDINDWESNPWSFDWESNLKPFGPKAEALTTEKTSQGSSWFLYVPWLRIKPTTLVYEDYINQRSYLARVWVLIFCLVLDTYYLLSFTTIQVRTLRIKSVKHFSRLTEPVRDSSRIQTQLFSLWHTCLSLPPVYSLIFIEHLQYTKHYFELFTQIISFNPHKNSWR